LRAAGFIAAEPKAAACAPQAPETRIQEHVKEAEEAWTRRTRRTARKNTKKDSSSILLSS
jgi:hypothetical protein